MALGALARTAANYDIRRERNWRPMNDTARDLTIASCVPLATVGLVDERTHVLDIMKETMDAGVRNSEGLALADWLHR